MNIVKSKGSVVGGTNFAGVAHTVTFDLGVRSRYVVVVLAFTAYWCKLV